MIDREIDVGKTLKMLFGEREIQKGSYLVGTLYDSIFESKKWTKTLPYLQFPAHWHVKITPAFASAIIRFSVQRETTPSDENISIYFDGYQNLGCAGKPYWEIYPNCEGDNARFFLGDEKEMFEEIEKALDRLEKE